jgi:hypothetical protein
MNLSSSSSPYQATYMDLKFGDLTKVEVVVPRIEAYQAAYMDPKFGDPTKVELVFDGESHPVGHNQLIPPMRHILIQCVWWNFTREQVLDSLSPNYDELPLQDDMDSPTSLHPVNIFFCELRV